MTRLSPALTARTRLGAGLLAVGLLGLTACGDDAAPAPAASTATATQALPSMDMAPFTLDVPSMDLAAVPGASLAVVEGEDPEYHAAWLQVPGAPAWTTAMDESVRGQVAQYQRDTDRSASPVLDVQPRLAVAGDDMAAARLLSTERRGDRSVSTVHMVWYSAREDRVLDTADLFTAEGWEAFRREVGTRMGGDPAIVQERLTSAVDRPDQVENERVWDGVVLLPDGSALVEVDQAAMAPADAGVITARIPADALRPWLSDLGRAAQQAAQHPGTLRLPERSGGAPGSDASTTLPGVVPGGEVPAPSASSPTVPGAPGLPGSTPAGAPSSGAPGSATTPGAPGAPVDSSSAGAGAPAVPGAPAPGTSAGGTAPTTGGSAPTTGGTAPTSGGSAPTTSAPAAPAPGPTSGGGSAPTTAPAPAPTSGGASTQPPTTPTPAPTSGGGSAPTTAPAPAPTSSAPSEPAPAPTGSAPTATAPSSATPTATSAPTPPAVSTSAAAPIPSSLPVDPSVPTASAAVDASATATAAVAATTLLATPSAPSAAASS